MTEARRPRRAIRIAAVLFIAVVSVWAAGLLLPARGSVTLQGGTTISYPIYQRQWLYVSAGRQRGPRLD